MILVMLQTEIIIIFSEKKEMETETGKLFVGGISWETSEDRLRDYFQTFGEVTEAVIMKDRNTGRARGFGFVVFSNASVAERVLRERHVIDGRIVEAKKAVPREDHQSFHRSSPSTQGSPAGPTRTRKIFVGGLPSSITEADFRRYFDQFGTITDVVVMYDHNTQRPRGFGFITFDTEESVDKVLVKNFHELHGKMVEVKRAVPKELSLGPTRISYGVNRPNIPLNNGYAMGHYGVRIDGRFGPVSNDRSGPYGIGNLNAGLRLDSRLGLNDGNGGDSYSYFSGSPSRFGSPMSNDHGNGRSVSFVNGNLWGNSSLNYTQASNAYLGHRMENHRLHSNLGTTGGTWDRSTNTPSKNGGDIVYDRSNSWSRQLQFQNYGGNIIGPDSPYSLAGDVRGKRKMEDLYESDSFFTDYPWQSLPNELDLSTNLASNGSAAFVGDYSVTAR